MIHIYIIINKYIYDVTLFNKFFNIKNLNLQNFHLKDATFDLVLKHENDDTFNLFENAKLNKSYLGINLLCKNIFKKNIPNYFCIFYTKQSKLDFLSSLLNNFILYLDHQKNNFYLIINTNNKNYFLNLVYVNNNWCYYSKKGIYNSCYIEDLIDLLIKDDFKKFIKLI